MRQHAAAKKRGDYVRLSLANPDSVFERGMCNQDSAARFVLRGPGGVRTDNTAFETAKFKHVMFGPPSSARSAHVRHRADAARSLDRKVIYRYNLPLEAAVPRRVIRSVSPGRAAARLLLTDAEPQLVSEEHVADCETVHSGIIDSSRVPEHGPARHVWLLRVSPDHKFIAITEARGVSMASRP
jgi:hypothetical protein